MATFLLEIRTEEIPANALAGARRQLEDLFTASLDEAGYTGFEIAALSTSLASAGATNLALVTFLIPVSAILLGVAFLAERLQGEHMIGMALIIAPLAPTRSGR